MTDTVEDTPSPDPFRSRALACLREARVRILGVHLTSDWRPIVVMARVRSSRDGHPYRVQYRSGAWSCTCVDGMHGRSCAHVRAVQLVTLEPVA